jgi:hypothetical protein
VLFKRGNKERQNKRKQNKEMCVIARVLRLFNVSLLAGKLHSRTKEKKYGVLCVLTFEYFYIKARYKIQFKFTTDLLHSTNIRIRKTLCANDSTEFEICAWLPSWNYYVTPERERERGGKYVGLMPAKP